jgi:hypothetical protein
MTPELAAVSAATPNGSSPSEEYLRPDSQSDLLPKPALVGIVSLAYQGGMALYYCPAPGPRWPPPIWRRRIAVRRRALARRDVEHTVAAMSKERYIAAKQKWAEKQKARGVTARSPTRRRDRLPPGQKLTTGFPVLDLGIQPEIRAGGLDGSNSTVSWRPAEP